jgi:hypothetical protein
MMSWPKTLKVLALSCLLLLVACSQKRPVLYPNYHLQEVGEETAQTEIDECISLAKEYGTSSSSSGKVAKSTRCCGRCCRGCRRRMPPGTFPFT